MQTLTIEAIESAKKEAIEMGKALSDTASRYYEDCSNTPYIINCVGNNSIEPYFNKTELIEGWKDFLNKFEQHYAVIATNKDVIYENVLSAESLDEVIETVGQEKDIDLDILFY